MGYPYEAEPHTLAQFARRAKISEGRARALFTATPSGLPRPDRHDAGGRPLWFAGTIDAWCARTGRAVAEDALWIFRAPETSAPAVELQRGVVTVRRRRQQMFVIVWDTEHGHVIYLQPLGDTGGEHKDWMAHAGAELIEPRWWSSAVIVMPVDEVLGPDPLRPFAYVYRITVRDDVAETDAEAPLGGVRRWFRRTPPLSSQSSSPPRARWEGQLDLADLAKVVGHPIPAWLSGTTTVDNARQSLAYDRTFTTRDTVTEWPATQARLERAIEIGLPRDYPAGFAALAADAGDGLRVLREAHEQKTNQGEGWYLVCRPAKPAPPLELEQLITTASPVEDLDLVAAELTELRRVERDLTVDDPRGEVYAETIRVLTQQLRRHEREAKDHRYLAVLNDDFTIHSAPWEGPVVEAWRKHLTPTDPGEALRLRRVQRLVDNGYEEMVREAYRDPDGRYVLVIRLDNGEIYSRAEWPLGLETVATWTDETVLAADDRNTVVTLLALTPTADGTLRTDPVPMAPWGGREAFAYGYGGGTPGTTFGAILRCALGEEADIHRVSRHAVERGIDGDGASQLWKAIVTTTGPLRLSWPQVQLWARADRKAAEMTS
ncbi:hypothetical protein [Amycolatopsis sacchari]|uniref:hypothetical protein n=1 Tax=Amycolatopsis sacchari TaxID=115433 RepID=UPI003D726DB9